MTGIRRHLIIAAAFVVAALALGGLLDLADAGRTATIVAVACFVAVAAPIATIAGRLRRKD